MSSNVTVLIAEAERIPSMRADHPVQGTVLYFSNANLASALESVRAHSPQVIALESHFADSGEGRAFVDRLRGLDLPASSELKMLCRLDGQWSTVPFASPVGLGTSDPTASGLNTRRAPRFLVLDAVEAAIDGANTNVIDLSVLGAQVISEPVLRPRQRIKVVLHDDGDIVLRFSAHVAWSAYEKKRHLPTPYYRAGMEFDDGTRQALEDYCRRHCASDAPLPYRG